MFSYAVTCLKWGDDPNNTFTILFSKKTNIIDIKLKILKRLNLNNDMIDKIKYYKVDEELYSDDKRFNIMKSKDSYKLISPEQIFNITKVNDVYSLIVSFTDVENSFNTEESIGAIIVVDENINDIMNTQPLTNVISEKEKILKNKDIFNSYNEFNHTFYHDDDDENYNGDYEDEFSESDNKHVNRKVNIRNRKEKSKRQMQKEEKEDLKNRMSNCKKYMCNSIKDNNCHIHKKQETDNINSTTKLNNIPTPTEDIINMGAIINMDDSINSTKYSLENLSNKNTSPTFVSSVSPNKVEALIIKQSTPQSLQYNPTQSQDINTTTYSNICANTLQNEIISSDISTLNEIKNDLVIKEETVEKIISEDIPDLQTKSIKVQCTSNENLNQKPDFLYSETIITENESRITPQTINTSVNPRTIVTPTNDVNHKEDNLLTSNTLNENYNHYTKTQPSRIYYPESDIEVMEFNK
eukprot:jgi/Orpsp1_1/1177455/evm.model.c7180000061496.1